MSGRRSLVTPSERFWAKVDKEGQSPDGGCWIWTGARTDFGYGKLTSGGRWRTAHRMSFEIEHGPIPGGMLVCHRCDTPACVRPSHLFLGTPQQNTRDMHAKGRAALKGAEGVKNVHAKLKDEQVVAIRQRFAGGEQINTLAAEFGVGVSSISNIVNGRRWKHLAGPVRPRGQIGRRPNRKAA